MSTEDLQTRGSFLRIYLHESLRHRGVLAWQWLMQQANGIGVRGGSAFRSIGGFGRHHHLQQEHFFELAGTQAIEVEFVVTDAEAELLLELLARENIVAFYVLIPARFGVIAPGGAPT